MLLERLPPTLQAYREELRPEDYPAVQYWYKRQWTTATTDRVTDIKGKECKDNEDDENNDLVNYMEGYEVSAPGPKRGQKRSAAGINVRMRYIQVEDGTVIDGHRAQEIRNHARAIFVGFAHDGKFFPSWGDSDAKSRKIFYMELTSRFPELRLCDLDWKADQIATDTFPGWKITWLKKQNKLKRENVDLSGDDHTQKRVKASKESSPASTPLTFHSSSVSPSF